jgi:hypothetical protein
MHLFALADIKDRPAAPLPPYGCPSLTLAADICEKSLERSKSFKSRTSENMTTPTAPLPAEGGGGTGVAFVFFASVFECPKIHIY